MKLNKFLFFVCVAALVPTIALAKVAPFGISVGTSDITYVKKIIGSKTKIKNAGFNKWTNGKMLKSSGVGLGIEGLTDVTYIFNEKDLLVGVMLNLPKSRYEDILSSLKEKYQLINEVNPFVGDRLARLKEDNVNIDVSAPHLSFNMSVDYVHDELMEKYNTLSAEESSSKKSEEISKL